MANNPSITPKSTCRQFANLPDLPSLAKNSVCPLPPDDGECFRLWNKYDMLASVRAHSKKVAHIATALAMRARERDMAVSVDETRASALLHDLAKTYCVRYGGAHALLGAAWTVAETGNYRVARGVMLHVHWPWELPEGPAICDLPFFVIYADKRVRHDACVSIDERFEDLLKRYGRGKAARKAIRASWEQARELERRLELQLKWSLHENTFDCGRMVQ